MKFFRKCSPIQSGLLVGITASLLASVPAAGAAITMSVGSVVAAPGSTMDFLDVDLTNSGASPVTIGAFAFEISLANSDIDVTEVDTSTEADYIFSGNSLFGPDLSGPNGGQTISASDIVSVPLTGTTLSSGQTLGLGRVLFDVSATAVAGVSPVDLASYPLTSLSDASGNNIGVETLSPGQIRITGLTAVPEPSSLYLLLSSGIAALLCIAVSRRGWVR